MGTKSLCASCETIADQISAKEAFQVYGAVWCWRGHVSKAIARASCFALAPCSAEALVKRATGSNIANPYDLGIGKREVVLFVGDCAVLE
jgi:hypothetical protein